MIMKKLMILGMIAISFTSCTTIKSGMSVTDEQASLSVEEKVLTTERTSSKESSMPMAQVASKRDSTKVWIHPAER